MGTDTIVFHSPDTPPFRLHGFHWRKPGVEFRRLPLRSVKLPLPDGVDGLAWHAAGGQLAFRSDTSQVVIRARLARPHRIVRAALTGLLGFDCYVGEPGRQLFCGVTTFGMDDLEYTSPVFKQHSRLMRSTPRLNSSKSDWTGMPGLSRRLRGATPGRWSPTGLRFCRGHAPHGRECVTPIS